MQREKVIYTKDFNLHIFISTFVVVIKLIDRITREVFIFQSEHSQLLETIKNVPIFNVQLTQHQKIKIDIGYGQKYEKQQKCFIVKKLQNDLSKRIIKMQFSKALFKQILLKKRSKPSLKYTKLAIMILFKGNYNKELEKYQAIYKHKHQWYQLQMDNLSSIQNIIQNSKDTLFIIVTPFQTDYIKYFNKTDCIGGIYIHPKYDDLFTDQESTMVSRIDEQNMINSQNILQHVIDNTNNLSQIFSEGVYQINNIDIFQPYLNIQCYCKQLEWMERCSEQCIQIDKKQNYFKAKEEEQRRMLQRYFSKPRKTNNTYNAPSSQNTNQYYSIHKYLTQNLPQNLYRYLKYQYKKKIQNYKQGIQQHRYVYLDNSLNRLQQQLVRSSILYNPVSLTSFFIKIMKINNHQDLIVKREHIVKNELQQLYKLKGLISQENDKNLRLDRQLIKQFLQMQTDCHVYGKFLKLFAILYTSNSVYQEFNKSIKDFNFKLIAELSAILILGAKKLGINCNTHNINKLYRAYNGLASQFVQMGIWPAFTSTSLVEEKIYKFSTGLYQDDNRYIQVDIKLMNDGEKSYGRSRDQWVLNLSQISCYNQSQILILPGFHFKQTKEKQIQIKRFTYQDQIQQRPFHCFDVIQCSDQAILYSNSSIPDQSSVYVDLIGKYNQGIDITKYKCCQRLQLSDNKLNSILKQIKQMRQLTHLWLNNNLIKQLSNDLFTNLVNIQNLYINNNRIEYLVVNAQNLQHLQANNNQIKRLKINSKKLKYLYLDKNNLKQSDIKLLSNQLRVISLKYQKKGQLKTIKNLLSCQKCLQQLYLDGNKFSSIPTNFQNPQILKHLSLKNNLIKEIILDHNTSQLFQNSFTLTLLQNYISSLPPQINRQQGYRVNIILQQYQYRFDL